MVVGVVVVTAIVFVRHPLGEGALHVVGVHVGHVTLAFSPAEDALGTHRFAFAERMPALAGAMCNAHQLHVGSMQQW
jgi:hypothetical protein